MPTVRASERVANLIDAFVRAKLQEQGLELAPPDSPRALFRRLYFGLVGLPPSPEQMQAFLADPSPAAYRQQMEERLADDRYGKRWGRHWLDLVRYADTQGGALDYARPHMWQYRNYVIRAFNEDRPYDRFIREQLAGNLIDNAIKDTHAGGRVTVSASQKSGLAELTVADTGEVIAGNHLSGVFDRFYHINRLRSVARALGRIGSDPKAAVLSLIEAFKDEHATVCVGTMPVPCGKSCPTPRRRYPPLSKR